MIMTAPFCSTGEGEISATTAGDKLVILIENLRFGGRQGAADLDDIRASNQESRQGGAMIVNAHVDRWNTTAQLRGDGVVTRKIDKGGKDSTMRVTHFGIGHELLTPRQQNFHALRGESVERHA